MFAMGSEMHGMVFIGWGGVSHKLKSSLLVLVISADWSYKNASHFLENTSFLTFWVTFYYSSIPVGLSRAMFRSCF
jgi:hypothetical protein